MLHYDDGKSGNRRAAAIARSLKLIASDMTKAIAKRQGIGDRRQGLAGVGRNCNVP